MMIQTFVEALWPCIAACITYLQAQRKEPLPELVRSGLNFSIVLGAACYVEGVLETILHAMLALRGDQYNKMNIPDLDLRRALNFYHSRVEAELEADIRRATGTAGYDSMFGILAGQRLSELVNVQPLWEGITILFNFRNVLGHGREVLARHYSGGFFPGGFKEEFTGSYRLVEDYLHKRQLLSHKFVEAHAEFLYLAPEIADHFWDLARRLPDAILTSLPDDERKMCQSALERVATAAQQSTS